MEPERIATNTYDFEAVRKMGYTYVDKTGLLYPLVDGSMGNQFFLSRPRRFGKSLLCSTIQKLFEGRCDLLEGLAIDSLPWDWSVKYPVIHLDVNMCSGEAVADVEDMLLNILRGESRRLGVPLQNGGGLQGTFVTFINRRRRGTRWQDHPTHRRARQVPFTLGRQSQGSPIPVLPRVVLHRRESHRVQAALLPHDGRVQVLEGLRLLRPQQLARPYHEPVCHDVARLYA